VLALEVFIMLAGRKRVLASVKAWSWAAVGKKQVLASMENQPQWLEKKLVLALMEDPTATVGRQRVLASGVELHTRGGEKRLAADYSF